MMAGKIITKENLLALAICLVIIGLIILTSDNAPLWIYQGF
ncbi:MAG: hypothetical protein Q8N39_06465 [Pelolinea sp.]|nr:hypothetical protein [Pelolinea sp.]